MEISIDYKTFKSEVKTFISKGNELKEKNPKTEEDLQEFIKDKKSWENDCSKYLQNSFTGEENDFFAKSFLESNSFNLGYTLPIEQRIKNTKNDLIEKVNNLDYYLRLLNTSDAFINPELVKKEGRDDLTVQQKKLLLLKKLKELNDGKYYDVNYILWSNGIKVNNYDEPREIAKSLKQYDYINTMGNARGVSACITIEGIEYLESLEDQTSTSKTTGSNPDMESINTKLDEVIEWLKRNDMGNEIIFNEMQEVKDAGEKLDLKNWKQLLKGKLFDLGADKAIGLGVEGAKYIFKTLTGEDIAKLIG